MTNNKTSPRNHEIVSQIKKEMVNYIGPIFEDLKTDIRRLDSRITTGDSKMTTMDSKITTMDSKITTMDSKISNLKGEIIHEVKILLENDRRIDLAMESAQAASDNAVVVKDLEERVNYLEEDLKIIKAIKKF